MFRTVLVPNFNRAFITPEEEELFAIFFASRYATLVP